MAKVQSDSVYRIIDVVGVSETSWEDAGRKAVETPAGSLRDLAGANPQSAAHGCGYALARTPDTTPGRCYSAHDDRFQRLGTAR